jgi:isopentenyl-diphosphate delta-isomerase type 1
MTLDQLTKLLESHKASLLQEIRETKELKELLVKGLRQPLTDEERRKIRHQLLDICRGIPALSLALSAPGGAVLLLLLYRLLPGYLIPSAFRKGKAAAHQSEELFSIVDEDDNVIGTATRQECHHNPLLIHRAVHVLVFTPSGDLFLQKRSPAKDIQPGKWDTSAGGHLKPGEDYRTAAYRELAEELGICGVRLTYLYKYSLRNSTESENIATYKCVFNGEIKFNPQEITAVQVYRLEDIRRSLGSGIFTPNFEEEFARYLEWQAARTERGRENQP